MLIYDQAALAALAGPEMAANDAVQIDAAKQHKAQENRELLQAAI